MGTRNLTIVEVDDEPKVVQYGQWDGYPTGQGETIAKFLRTVDLKKFKEQVKALKKYTKRAMEKAYDDAGAPRGSEYISMEVSNKKNRAHPALDRDHGAGILQLIHDGIVTKVQFCSDYDVKCKKVAEDTWCEYWYVINLDKKTVQMNGGKKYSFAQWTRKGLMKKLEKSEE